MKPNLQRQARSVACLWSLPEELKVSGKHQPNALASWRFPRDYSEPFRRLFASDFCFSALILFIIPKGSLLFPTLDFL
jgi:hypothetical protein